MVSVLGDLVGRDRRSERVALRTEDRAISYHDFCTTAWKASHALRHLGVHTGSRVALAPDPAPQILETAFGAALLGARVTFDPDADARVVMGSVDREADLSGDRVVVYGGPPASTTATHWERVVWSENPAMPPDDVSAAAAVLDAEATTYTHRELLDAAAGVVSDANLDGETAVALRASLADPRAVVAGVIAPVSAGGTVVLPASDERAAVAVGEGPAEHRIRPDDVPL